MKHRLTLCLFFFFVVCSAICAQKTCRLYGTVRDQQGQALEFAFVRVANSLQMATTNLQGKYHLHITQGDSVQLVYSLIGYETRKRTIFATQDSLQIDITLPPYGTSIGETVVTGRSIQTSTTQQIKIEKNKLAPSVSGNHVETLIASQAGVSTHNELSSQYKVRGGSFDENVVYINGIEVYRPLLVSSGQQEGLSIINSDMVEKIAFSTGGFEAKYGDKMSSVLDITYKQPQAFEASATASLLGAGLYLGLGNKRYAFMSSLRYKSTSHLLGTLDTRGEYHPQFLDYQVAFSYRPSPRWSFDFLGNLSDNRFQFSPQDRETKFGTMFAAKSFKVYFDGQEKDLFRTRFGAATLTHHINTTSSVALQLSTFASKEQEHYDIQGQYWLHEATDKSFLGVGTYMEHARNSLQAKVWNLGLRFQSKTKMHHWQAGINWRSEYLKERSREWEMRDSMGYSLPQGQEQLRLIYALQSHNEIRTQRFEAFVQDTWRLQHELGLFTLNYGLRFSHWSWNSESLLSPRLALGFVPTGNHQWVLRGAIGLYYQTPFYKELRDTTLTQGIAQVQLNPHSKSQRSVHFVLGGDYSFRMMGRAFKFTTELYYKALSQLIPYSVNNLRIVYDSRHQSRGYTAGIDFKIFGEFVTGTDSWLSFSLMRSKEQIGGLWLPRPTDQRYNLSLHFTDYFPGSDRWMLVLRAALADGLPFGPPHSQRSTHIFRAPAYKRVDVGLNYQLFKVEEKQGRRPRIGWGRYVRKAWIGLDCFNLLGINNVNSYYWVTDITNQRYAVPNFLTGRQLNLRFGLDF